MGTFAAYEVPGINTGPDGRRYPHGASAGDFEPQYLCLAWVSFASAGIAARHAYFPMPSDLEAFAAAEFSAMSSTGQWASAPIRQDVNFVNFTFGSQQLVVFHFDPAGIPTRFDPANPIQFAPFGADGQAKARNNSFLNPGIRSWAGKEMLVLENWYVDEDGRPILPPLELYYTMNVHLLTPCLLTGANGESRELPLVLDPDTGNMGAEP
jgi:hypothetical protein